MTFIEPPFAQYDTGCSQSQPCREVAETLESPSLRLHLLGDLAIEVAGKVALDAQAVRGQSRLVLTYLAFNRNQAMPRYQLAALLWGEDVPDSWDATLSAILSRLCASLAATSLDSLMILSRDQAVARLTIAPGAWIDVEVAMAELDRAEGMIRQGERELANGPATVAVTILRRQLLPGDSSEWAESKREDLRRRLVRALDCLGEILRVKGETGVAIEMAHEAIGLNPLRERSYQQLIRAQIAAGDRAGAIQTFQQLKSILEDELGLDPAAESEELYLTIIK
jgi:DNA-binding SARP family transcriptional activator